MAASSLASARSRRPLDRLMRATANCGRSSDEAPPPQRGPGGRRGDSVLTDDRRNEDIE
jgi:hypothetical protein